MEYLWLYCTYENKRGNASAIHLDPLIKIQKKSIRAITFSEFSAPSEPLFLRTNILNFDKLVFQRIGLNV